MRNARKNESAREIAVIDAETDPFVYEQVPEPFIWGFRDAYRYRTFDDVGVMIDWLKDQDLIVYAHNGGKFDYHLKGFLAKLENFQSIMMINGRLASFTIGRCEFRDSFNILPEQLSKMGPKLEIDYDKLRREVRHRHMPEIKKYLKQDCDTLYELVSQFVRQYGLNLTLASAAMKQWRKISGMPSPRNQNQELFENLKPHYYGGRVECFAKGVINKPFKLADIKSAYPYAMLHDHPYGEGYLTERNCALGKPDPQAFYTLLCDHDGVFPVRTKNGLSFAPGKGVQVDITGWELIAAIETCSVIVKKCLKKITFGASINFRSYVDHFYRLKEAAPKDSFERLAAKLFLNSLYGKFGSNPLEYHEYLIIAKEEWNDDDPDANDGFERAAELGDWYVIKKKLVGHDLGFYNLGTAASVTGFVRAYLWRAIHGVRQAGGVPLYCDTDSLAYSAPGMVPLRYGKALGDWADEGTFVRGGIAGKKMYAFFGADGKPKVACKGVKLSAEEIMEVASGKTLTYRREAPSFSLRHGAKFITRQVKATI